MFKVLNITFGILFLICAGLQWNDPDPYLWMPLYLLSVLSCAYAYKGVVVKKLNIFNIALYAVYATYLFFANDGVVSWAMEHHFESLTSSMLASAPWIENTREFGGLFIMLVVCATNLYISIQQVSQETLNVLDDQQANA